MKELYNQFYDEPLDPDDSWDFYDGPLDPYDAWGMDRPEEGDDIDSDFNYND